MSVAGARDGVLPRLQAAHAALQRLAGVISDAAARESALTEAEATWSAATERYHQWLRKYPTPHLAASRAPLRLSVYLNALPRMAGALKLAFNSLKQIPAVSDEAWKKALFDATEAGFDIYTANLDYIHAAESTRTVRADLLALTETEKTLEEAFRAVLPRISAG